MISIILAGGRGSRLWPLSKQQFPKQFLSFGDSLSLLQKTTLRLLDCSERVLISTNDAYEAIVTEQIEKIDTQKKCTILIEPHRKNTAPSIAFAIRYLEEKLEAKVDDLVFIVPSDHLIDPGEIFFHSLELAKRSAQGPYLITFGIRPRKAETGYGYIQIGESFDGSTYKIKKFTEKPSQEVADEYILSEEYYWNSGMFLCKIGTFWDQMQKHDKEIYEIAKNSVKSITDNYSHFKDISIDYSLLEKSQDILLCPLSVRWSDIGSWDAIYEVLDKDAEKNATIGQVIPINTKNSLIFGNKKVISTIGIEELIIIDTDDALLVCKRGESQKVKQLIS